MIKKDAPTSSAKFITSRNLSWVKIALIGVVTAGVGIAVILYSHAAGTALGFEAEAGSKANGASTVADASASGGSALKFGLASTGLNAPPAGTSLTVDFRSTTHPLNLYSIGATISTYNGATGQANINKSATWKTNLAALGPVAWRIPLRYNNGNPGSSAGGGQTSGDAASYIQNIKAIGGVPVVVVGGDTSDNDFTNADAAGLVHYFNDNGGQHGGPVHAWVIGNEYTNGGNDPIGYQSHLAGWAAAMKAADSSITLSAPAMPDMKYADAGIAAAVANAAPYIDYLSYHAYQGSSAGLSATSDYETYANQYRTKYATTQNFGARASTIQSALEEFNWAPYSGAVEFFQWKNTVFMASVIGHSISAGAHAYEYSDSNGALGLMNDGNTTQSPALPGSLYTKFPAYWAIGMWTGLNGTFRRYGNNLVTSKSTVANVEVYATDNGKIMLINKDTSDHAITIGLGGKVNGTYDVWQTNQNGPTAAPTKVAANTPYTGSVVSVTLPAGTVSSLELN